MKTLKSCRKKEKKQEVGFFQKKDHDDLNAIELVKGGNPRAFAHIVHKYKPILYMKVVSAVRDENYAKDIVQEIFTKVYTNIGMYEKRFTFNAWFTRVATNYIIDVVRKRNISPEYNNKVELDAAFGLAPGRETPENVLELSDEDSDKFDVNESYEEQHAQEYSKIQNIINTLDAKDQAMLKLFYLEKKKQKQIAKILRMSHISVRVRLLRLKKKLLEMSDSKSGTLVPA